LRRSGGISGDKLEGSRGVNETKSFVEVMECSTRGILVGSVSELEGEGLNRKEVAN